MTTAAEMQHDPVVQQLLEKGEISADTPVTVNEGATTPSNPLPAQPEAAPAQGQTFKDQFPQYFNDQYAKTGQIQPGESSGMSDVLGSGLSQYGTTPEMIAAAQAKQAGILRQQQDARYTPSLQERWSSGVAGTNPYAVRAATVQAQNQDTKQNFDLLGELAKLPAGSVARKNAVASLRASEQRTGTQIMPAESWKILEQGDATEIKAYDRAFHDMSTQLGLSSPEYTRLLANDPQAAIKFAQTYMETQQKVNAAEVDRLKKVNLYGQQPDSPLRTQGLTNAIKATGITDPAMIQDMVTRKTEEREQVVKALGILAALPDGDKRIANLATLFRNDPQSYNAQLKDYIELAKANVNATALASIMGSGTNLTPRNTGESMLPPLPGAAPTAPAVPGAPQGRPTTAPASTVPAAPGSFQEDSALSTRGESGNNPAAINTTYRAANYQGAFGTHQFVEKEGARTASAFVNFLVNNPDATLKGFGNQLKAAGPIAQEGQFADTWKQLGANPAFAKAQDTFADQQFRQPLYTADPSFGERSKEARQYAYAVSVGVGPKVATDVLKANVDEEDNVLIDKLHAARLKASPTETSVANAQYAQARSSDVAADDSNENDPIIKGLRANIKALDPQIDAAAQTVTQKMRQIGVMGASIPAAAQMAIIKPYIDKHDSLVGQQNAFIDKYYARLGSLTDTTSKAKAAADVERVPDTMQQGIDLADQKRRDEGQDVPQTPQFDNRTQAQDYMKKNELKPLKLLQSDTEKQLQNNARILDTLQTLSNYSGGALTGPIVGFIQSKMTQYGLSGDINTAMFQQTLSRFLTEEMKGFSGVSVDQNQAIRRSNELLSLSDQPGNFAAKAEEFYNDLLKDHNKKISNEEKKGNYVPIEVKETRPFKMAAPSGKNFDSLLTDFGSSVQNIGNSIPKSAKDQLVLLRSAFATEFSTASDAAKLVMKTKMDELQGITDPKQYQQKVQELQSYANDLKKKGEAAVTVTPSAPGSPPVPPSVQDALDFLNEHQPK